MAWTYGFLEITETSWADIHVPDTRFGNIKHKL